MVVGIFRKTGLLEQIQHEIFTFYDTGLPLLNHQCPEGQILHIHLTVLLVSPFYTILRCYWLVVLITKSCVVYFKKSHTIWKQCIKSTFAYRNGSIFPVASPLNIWRKKSLSSTLWQILK